MKPEWVWILLFALMLQCSCRETAKTPDPPQLLPHDAYIWQRRWTPATVTAVQQSADLIRAWRVLVAQLDERGRLQPVSVAWEALARSGRPVIFVVRIEGQLVRWDENVLLNDISALLSRSESTMLPIAGIEIDHDCGTARLPTYARFLAKMRTQLGKEMPLSLTLLPTWLSSPDLTAVLAKVDEAVLQVHAVQNPSAGLFSPRLARQWIELLARRSTVPFRVALPAYGSRVSWRKNGKVLAVESETPLLAGGDTALEWMASPQEVKRLLQQLEQNPPAHLAGIVWFRLPTLDDARAWSPTTWRAVIQGRPLHNRVEVRVQPSATPGLNHLVVVNPGDVDATLPQAVSLPTECMLADGINGYVLERVGAGLILHRQQGGLLRGRHQQIIGWARCALEAETIHVRS